MAQGAAAKLIFGASGQSPGRAARATCATQTHKTLEICPRSTALPLFPAGHSSVVQPKRLLAPQYQLKSAKEMPNRLASISSAGPLDIQFINLASPRLASGFEGGAPAASGAELVGVGWRRPQQQHVIVARSQPVTSSGAACVRLRSSSITLADVNWHIKHNDLERGPLSGCKRAQARLADRVIACSKERERRRESEMARSFDSKGAECSQGQSFSLAVAAPLQGGREMSKPGRDLWLKPPRSGRTMINQNNNSEQTNWPDQRKLSRRSKYSPDSVVHIAEIARLETRCGR